MIGLPRIRLAAVVGIGAVFLILLVLLFAANSRIDLLTIERDQAIDGKKIERQAHVQSILNWRRASEAAQLAADRNADRVAAEQAVITEQKEKDYEARLAAVDARLRRVRAETAARSDLRSADLAPVSVASEAACQAYGGASCDGLLTKLAIAERQAANLIELRAWVKDQAAVQVTADRGKD